MIIFVEGCDGSGKSTLINQLSEHFIVVRIPRVAEDRYAWDKLCLMCKNLSDRHILVDRSPLTEYIYRSEERTESKFQFASVMNWLRRGKFVYCRSYTAHEDAMKRGEDNITTKSRHDKIQQFYDTFVPSLIAEGIKVMYYDWHEQSPNDVIKFIEEV